MNISLTKFCKETDLRKSTVHDRCRELGFDTSNGLTADMVDQICYEFDVEYNPVSETKKASTTEPQAVRPVVMPEGFITGSELAAVTGSEIQLPKGFDPSAMVKFFDGVAGEDVDSDGLLAIATVAINAASGAFDKKIELQRQRLNKTRQNAEKLQRVVGEAKEDMKIKALESRLLAAMQTNEATTSTAAFEELMALGKPAEEQEPDSGQA